MLHLSPPPPNTYNYLKLLFVQILEIKIENIILPTGILIFMILRFTIGNICFVLGPHPQSICPCFSWICTEASFGRDHFKALYGVQETKIRITDFGIYSLLAVLYSLQIRNIFYYHSILNSCNNTEYKVSKNKYFMNNIAWNLVYLVTWYYFQFYLRHYNYTSFYFLLRQHVRLWTMNKIWNSLSFISSKS